MQFPDNTTPVYNMVTGQIGLAVEIVPSPYVAEEMAGVMRVKVWAEVPSAGDDKGFGWDWWRVEETAAISAVSDDTLAIEPFIAA